MNIDYSSVIPNNVSLGNDRKLMRALMSWRPRFLDWWDEIGPVGFDQDEIYLRTAVSTEPGGWSRFGHVRMSEYRWGIFLADRVQDRRVPCGDDAGEAAWQEVPGDRRSALQSLIVTQADTEPASVEQQRRLGQTAPSLYDARNLFQVNVEEARHLWAMVYLLHGYFGRDGRDQADALLERRAGDENRPRLLEAFNQPCEDWISFFCFTCFTDRDGKFQLGALAESGFDPLSRSCRFMLTEEAHHLFIGERGIERIARRSAQFAIIDPNGDPRGQGGIDLPTLQKYCNYWFAYCLDLFGSEESSNSSRAFSMGLKGRWKESQVDGDHVCASARTTILEVKNGALSEKTVPLRRAMNELLRNEYIIDCQRVVERWNSALEAEGSDFEIRLPNKRFYRRQGLYSQHHFDPDGNLISEEDWVQQEDNWLPSQSDRDYVLSLMKPNLTPGKMAQWICPPRRGTNGKAVDFEYVRTA